MKTLHKAIGTFVLVLFGTLVGGSAMAQHGGHGYGYGFGISLGFPLYVPGYYPPYYPYPAYAYPPAVVESYSPPVYVEEGVAQVAPAPSQAQGNWYYCAASKTYYPYVRECPAGWQRVPAQPPSR